MTIKRKERYTDELFIIKKSVWKKIFNEFKKTYPRLSKKVIGYVPSGFLTIKVYLDDGMQLGYSSIDERAVILRDSDKQKK